MTKRKTKFLSLILSLILVLVSVPTVAFSEEISSDDISEEITTEFQSDLSITEQMSDITLQEPIEQMATTTSTVSWNTSNVLPDGIYSFSKNGKVSFYLQPFNNSTQAGAQMIILKHSVCPSINYSAYANFKVTRVPNTDRYIIRLMSNTNLTFGLAGTNIVTKTISANDSEVSINDMFYINYYNGGYTIQNCTAGYYVCLASASGSYVVSGSLSSNAIWKPRGYRSYIEDGVYMFENCGNTGLYMDTQYDSDSAGRHAQQYAYGSIDNTFSRGGMFKIKQIGNTGQYTIRLMTNNLLTWGANSSDEVMSESIPLSDDDVPDEQTYYIVYDFSGYMIIPYNTTKAISATANSTASGSSGAPDSYLDFINRNTPQTSARWKMYKYDGMPQYGGNIILPDELIDDGGVIGNTYTITHTVWYTMLDSCNYSLTLLDDIYVSQFTYDSDNLSATFTLSNFGKVECYLNASYEANNFVIRDISDVENFNAMPSEGTYYIQNSETEKYVTIEHLSYEEGIAVEQSEFSTANYFKWDVEHVEDSGGYVRLKSLHSGKYLAVDPNNSSNINQYASPGDNGLWRFELLDDYAVKIICKASESSGKVLAVPLLTLFDGANLTQREYTDNSNCTDEWTLIKQKSYYLVNYYDASFELDDELIDIIPEANEFVIKAFARAMNVELIVAGSPSYYSSIADNCSLGMYGRCDNEICGTTCDNHHKSVNAILNQLYNSQRDVNHIYILHSNRPDTYCKSLIDSHEHTDAYGCAEISKPNILVERLSLGDIEDKKISLSLIVAHELAHVFGLPEVYNLEHPTNKQPCVMDRYGPVNNQAVYSAYRKGQSIFCDYCTNWLNDLIDDIEYLYY